MGNLALLLLWLSPLPAQPAEGAPPSAAPAATATATASAPESPSPAAEPTAPNRLLRVAVLDVKALGVAGVAPRVTGASIVAEVRKLQDVVVVGIDEVRDALDFEAKRQLVGCSDDQCIGDIVGALGVDEIIVCSVARIGDESVFGLRRIRLDGTSLGQVEQRLEPADGEEFLAAVGPSVQAVYGDRPLRAGKVRGVSDTLALRLHPPPLPTFVFSAGVVTTGLVVVGALGSTAWWGYAVNAFTNNASNDGALVQNLSAQELAARTLTIGLWAGAASVGAATAIAVPFTDWNNLQAGVTLDAQ